MDESRSPARHGEALAPLPGRPPTALAASAPAPLHEPAALRTRTLELRGLVDSALDALDAIADRIAAVTGIR